MKKFAVFEIDINGSMRRAFEHAADTCDWEITLTGFAIGKRVQAKTGFMLPGGYWMKKEDDDTWQMGCDETVLGFQLKPNVPGGTFESDVVEFARAMNEGIKQ